MRVLLIRVTNTLATLWAITLVVFVLTYLTGSPADTLVPPDATVKDMEALIKFWGLDRPLHEQYFTFLGNLLHGDFGPSLKWSDRTAAEVVLFRLPASLYLGGVAVAVTVAVAVPLGVVSALHRDTWIDYGAGLIALSGQSLPQFWLGIILIWIFAVGLGWLPTSGRGTFPHLILPAITMCWFNIAALTRLTRSAMLDVLDSEYIKLARLKGVPERIIVWKHALRNAAIVPMTYFAVLSGYLLTGSVIVETVFAWPGIGWLAIEAIRGRDYPVVQAVIIIFAVIFVLANLLVDLLYAYVDPRIRYR